MIEQILQNVQGVVLKNNNQGEQNDNSKIIAVLTVTAFIELN